jgi:hypothetical protein
MAHLGTRVSALLDGQLGREEEERAWAHVHGCHACRDLVEHEGWVKTRLHGLALRDPSVSSSLKGTLFDPAACAVRPAAGAGAVPPSRLRMVALGGGAVGAAFLGVLALTVTPGPGQAPGTGTDRRPPVTSLSGTPSRAPASVPASVRLGPRPGPAEVPGVRMDP